jgi:uncharacterized membrane protein SirB2
MNTYHVIKLIHVSAAAISIIGFVARFALRWSGSPLLQRRALRIIPHVNDTVLLGAALAMLWLARVNPVQLPWLSAKIVALLIYIALGMIALRPRTGGAARLAAFIGALLAFAHIVAAALTRSPLGIFAWF